MSKKLRRFYPIAEGLSNLLYPHAEVVIHDLKSNRIVAIFNNFSKRKVGDESLLQEELEDAKLLDVFPIYFKTNWDGRRLKCVSITLKDENGIALGLLCINLDVSQWEEMGKYLLQWTQGLEGSQPEVLFKDDWREKINTYVSEYLKREKIVLKNLTKEKKKELILSLHREGAFSAKNAAFYIADVLDISRATIYNYLRSK